MALKAGRVGVANDQVDPVSGKVLGDNAEYPEGVMSNRELTALLSDIEEIRTGVFTFDNQDIILQTIEVSYSKPFKKTFSDTRKIILILSFQGGSDDYQYTYSVTGVTQDKCLVKLQNVKGVQTSSGRNVSYIAIKLK